MPGYTESIEKLIESLIKFPGVGRRSAERIATYILNTTHQEAKELADAIIRVKENVRFCALCHNLSESDLCRICSDTQRHKDVICVVEKPADVTAIEKAGNFSGVYHVLMGSISPLEGRGPADLKIQTLLDRVKINHIKEVIIATDADTEGETTSLYLTKVLKPTGVNISRIGLGLPVGSNLEYADSITLNKSLEARRQL